MMEYAHFLKEKYPSLQISSEVKQASSDKLMLAQVLSWVQMGAFAISFFGKPIFQAISMEQPAWALYLEENRGVAIMGFFFGNTIISSMVQVPVEPLLQSLTLSTVITLLQALFDPQVVQSALRN